MILKNRILLRTPQYDSILKNCYFNRKVPMIEIAVAPRICEACFLVCQYLQSKSISTISTTQSKLKKTSAHKHFSDIFFLNFENNIFTYTA